MTSELIEKLNISEFLKISIDDAKKLDTLEKLKDQYNKAKQDIQERFEDKVLKIRQGDELLPSVMKMVKVLLRLNVDLDQAIKCRGDTAIKGL